MLTEHDRSTYPATTPTKGRPRSRACTTGSARRPGLESSRRAPRRDRVGRLESRRSRRGLRADTGPRAGRGGRGPGPVPRHPNSSAAAPPAPHGGAVTGPWGLRSGDLRHFEEAAAGDVDAIEGYVQGFRRSDYVDRGPLDEHFRFYRNLDIWWSLVLRDEGVAMDPRRALQLAG